MSLQADLYFSFRSPYSYLCTPLLTRQLQRWDFSINLRPVMPLAVRSVSFFTGGNPMLPMYILRDSMRVAQFHEIPYAWPNPDPIVQDPSTMKVAEEQPYIWRITRLGVCAAQRGDGFAFAREVSETIFSGRVQGWNEGTHLAEAAERAGFDLAELETEIAADTERFDALIQENHKGIADVGHWGVPCLVFNDEPFWGQDRIELFIWRLKQAGLKARKA